MMKIKHFLSILMLFYVILGFSQTDKATLRRNDSLELVKLYQSTNGAEWTNKWDLSKPMDSWAWLILDSTKCNVSGLFISNFKGTIPDLDLPKLLSLNFQSSEITSQIPNFSKLPNLQAIIFNACKIIGEIPNFDKITNLKYLKFKNNQLSGKIPDCKFLTKLREIDFEHNQLTGGLPNFNLPNLTYLSVGSNELSGKLPDFSYLKKLIFLVLFCLVWVIENNKRKNNKFAG